MSSNPLENALGGRDRLDFGTVRLRVQIPGPGPMIRMPTSQMAARRLAASGQPARSAELEKGSSVRADIHWRRPLTI
jgi:hypothetical protein